MLSAFSLKKTLRRLAWRVLGEVRVERYPGYANVDQEKLKSCGARLSIQAPITIEGAEHVDIGSDVSFAAYVHLWGSGGIQIGNRVMIGAHSSISSLTHDYHQLEMFKTLLKKRVVIEDDVWIGSNCVILPGITLGKGSVIGAGSVVTKDVEAFSIVVGVPARKIKSREWEA